MKKIRSKTAVLLVAGLLAAISGCTGQSAGLNGGLGAMTMAWPTDASVQVPRAAGSYEVDALIFNGVGTAGADMDKIASILDSHGKSYQIVSSDELNSMTLDDLSRFGVIVWPGGYATQMSNSLTAETRTLVRKAVVERGVGFTGFCAGAFIAVSPLPEDGQPQGWGFSILPQETLPYYYLEDQGVVADMVQVSLADGQTRDLVWYGGPTTPEVSGGVIARYPNGQPAISQTWAGRGFVVISGPHPESPDSWRTSFGLVDSDGSDDELAFQLINAALQRRPL